jgi:hypothetical protein
MSEDQFQRHVDFIVAQQAKFETNIAKLEENLARHEQETVRCSRSWATSYCLANHGQEQDDRIAAHDRQIAALIEAGKEADRRFKETDERINALIILAERFFNRKRPVTN